VASSAPGAAVDLQNAHDERGLVRDEEGNRLSDFLWLAGPVHWKCTLLVTACRPSGRSVTFYELLSRTPTRADKKSGPYLASGVSGLAVTTSAQPSRTLGYRLKA
jgi:hypothetical protein